MTKNPHRKPRILATAQLAIATGGYTLTTQSTSLELLSLQQELQAQDRHFTSVTNILAARHETQKSTISNLG